MSTSPSDNNLPQVQAVYYDGISSRAYLVQFSISEGNCLIRGSGMERDIPLTEVAISEQLDRAQRIIRFNDGSSCEMAEDSRLAALFNKAAVKDSFVNRLQRRWRWVFAATLLFIALCFAGYQWGFPFIAEKLAYRLPYEVLNTVSTQAMKTLDEHFAKPSKLAPERQAALLERFSSTKLLPGQVIPLKVQFRHSDGIGANAFALPDGTIVFFDGLVNLAQSDDQLVAVYAHEAGHVASRHSMRQLIQVSALAVTMAVYFGDASSIAAALSGWLLQAKYSRDFERDADRYAAAVLRQNHMSPALLGEFLQRLEDAHDKRGPKGRKSASSDPMLDYISSHPSTAERIRDLESY